VNKLFGEGGLRIGKEMRVSKMKKENVMDTFWR
jgi:hypothetical protein